MITMLFLGQWALARNPDLPAALEVEPNAIQSPEGSMSIEVSGVPHGGKVWLEVLQDCDRDQVPDRRDQELCRSPLYARWSQLAEHGSKVHDRFNFTQLAADGHALPEETVLWLRASRTVDGPGLSVRFGLVSDPCSLWRSAVDAFLGGECNPGLVQALRRHRGPSGVEDVTFEVRLVTLDQGAEARPVPATRGATGVAWLDRRTLLIARAPAPGEPGVTEPAVGVAWAGDVERVRGLTPGLYRVPLSGGEPDRLWAPAEGDDWLPAAPLALPDGRVAFVRQRLNAQAELTGEPMAYLHVLQDGRLDPGVALPYKVHQLLAADAASSSVLVLTLGVAASKPALLVADFAAGEARYLGYHRSLYHAALRSPAGRDAVIAREDNSGQYGWDLVMVDDKGRFKRFLVNRRGGHQLLPAWRPDGGEVAFLAEVARAGPRR